MLRRNPWDFLRFLVREAPGAGAGDGGAGAGAGAGAGSGSGGGAAPGGAAAAAAALAGQGNGGASGGASGDGAPGGAPGGQGGGAPAAYLPEGITDDFKGASDKDTIDKLWSFVNGAEKPPAKADGYELKLDEALTKRFGDMKDDPALQAFREVAHDVKLTNTQFNDVFSKFYTKLAEKGLIEAPIDGYDELDKLAPKGVDQVRGRAEAAQRTNAVVANLNGMVQRGNLTKAESEMFMALAARAEGVVALEKFMKGRGEHGIQVGGQPGGGRTLEDVKADMRDPRYDSLSPKFDQAFRDRIDQEWQTLRGGRA